MNKEKPIIILYPISTKQKYPMELDMLNDKYFLQFNNADDLCTDCRKKGLYGLFDCECKK